MIFAGIGASAAAVVRLLGPPERLPIPFCAFKLLTGWPCPTCGGTRALYCLSHMDVAGALAMNPLATFLAVIVGAWAVADLALWPRRRSLRFDIHASLVPAARITAVVLAAINWIYLLAAGR